MLKVYLLLALMTSFFPRVLFAQETYLYCGKLIDVKAGKVLTEMTIVVEGKKIKSVNDGYIKPLSNTTIIDLKDKTVLPGLMDMHVHMENMLGGSSYLDRFTIEDAAKAYRCLPYAEKTLLAGFTTVRDLGGTGVNIALRDAIAKGYVKGPRIFTAGKAISVTGGHADPTNGAREDVWQMPGPDDGVADGPDACRKAVRYQYKRGADLIKITATGGVLSVAKDGFLPHFTLEEMTAIIETASDLGFTVAAHAHGDEGMYRAVQAGVTSIEHGTMMSDSTMELMIRKGTWFVPTITAGKAVADSASVKGFYPEVVAIKAAFIGPQIQKTFARAYKKGVKIAFGTDAGVYPHGLNALEFQFMTEVGMTPMEALQTATINAAELLRVTDQLGTIEPGKWADIIAVKENPLQNIKTLQNVVFVMKEGIVYKN